MAGGHEDRTQEMGIRLIAHRERTDLFIMVVATQTTPSPFDGLLNDYYYIVK